MRTFILSLLFLQCFINVLAQKNRLQELKEQLANHPQKDTFRVNCLNKIALKRELSTAGRDSAVNEALLLARQLNFKEGEVHALLAQAQTKDMIEAIALEKQALLLAEKTGNSSLVSAASTALGYRLAGTEQKDQSLHYLMRGIEIALSTNDKSQLAFAQKSLSEFYLIFNADYVKSLDWALKALHSAEQSNDTNALAGVWAVLAPLYNSLGDNTTSLNYYQKAIEANEKIGNATVQAILLGNRGELYRLSGKYPEALRAYQEAQAITDDAYIKGLGESNQADVYDRMGNYPAAKQYAFSSLIIARKRKDTDMTSWIYSVLGRISLHTGKPDSALYYGKLGYEYAIQVNDLEMKRDNSQILADAYAQKKIFDKAYTFQNLYVSYRDSMMNSDVKNQASLLKFNSDLQKKQAEITVLNKDKELHKAEAQRQYYLLIGALAALLLIAALVLVLYRNNLHKQKANNILQKQKLEIQNQRDQTNEALKELKAMQAQLIHSEKMASFGELTAGIAHEIQNPLNFVNNFSEVSNELINEMVEEVDKGNTEEVKLIASDIKQNLEKINHHGKRADSIVKGMLQHSRKSEGKKEPININALCDEYLKLSYHGMRAKDKFFNAEIKTDLDESVRKINVVPQDIGRVLLNLFNNAFYAVNEKKQKLNGTFQPVVLVSTNKLDGNVIIKVVDNGNGIPQNINDKIFQPFFTTKPTGEGTGLGLSLSYDIIKAHGGEIQVETKEGEGSTFTIQLPAS